MLCYICRSNIEEAGHISLHIGIDDVAVVLVIEVTSGRRHGNHSSCMFLPLDWRVLRCSLFQGYHWWDQNDKEVSLKKDINRNATAFILKITARGHMHLPTPQISRTFYMICLFLTFIIGNTTTWTTAFALLLGLSMDWAVIWQG